MSVSLGASVQREVTNSPLFWYRVPLKLTSPSILSVYTLSIGLSFSSVSSGSVPPKAIVLIATLLFVPWIARAGVAFQSVGPVGPSLAVISKMSLSIIWLPTRKLLR